MSHRWKRFTVPIAALAVVAAATACTSDHHPDKPKPSQHGVQTLNFKQGLTVSGSQLPAGINAVYAPVSSVSGVDKSEMVTIGAPVDVTPTGNLQGSATLTIKLSPPVPTDGSVGMITAESPNGPWTLEPSTVSPDGSSISVTTNHFSLHWPFQFNVGDMINQIKDAFKEGVAGDAVTEAKPPTCTGQSKALSDNYATGFTGKQTLYWCFGYENGQRVLKVVNRRRYPLSLSHTGLKFIGYAGIDADLPGLSRLASGPNTLVLPFQEAHFSVGNLKPGQTVAVHSQFDRLAQDIYQLQVGLNTLVDIVTKEGGSTSKAAFVQQVKLLGDALSDQQCGAAALSGNVPNMFRECLKDQLFDKFSWARILLGPVITAGALFEFFRSGIDAIGDQINHRDNFTVVVGRLIGLSSFVGSWTGPPKSFDGESHTLTVNSNGTGTLEKDQIQCYPDDRDYVACLSFEKVTFTLGLNSITSHTTSVSYTVDTPDPVGSFGPKPPIIDRTYIHDPHYKGVLDEINASGKVVATLCNLKLVSRSVMNNVAICGS